MKPRILFSLIACSLSLLATSHTHAQGLRVPGGSSFGNDWRVGSTPGASSGYGSADAGSSSNESSADTSAPRPLGRGSSSYGSTGMGSGSGSANPGSGSMGSGSGSTLPSLQPTPRTPGGGLRAN